MTKKISIELGLTGVIERVFEKDSGKIHYVVEPQPFVVSEDVWNEIKDLETLDLSLKK